jgi:arylsulfatase A-like enzyme
MVNPGRGGRELADEVVPIALDWLERNAEQDNWFLHVNLWDPHTPYDAPDEFGNPFKDDPPPAWLTEEILERHKASYGPHSAREPISWDEPEKPPTPRMPTAIANLGDYKRWIDGYDVGIRYMDDRIERIFDLLSRKGVMDDLVIIISSDHGENQGELNVYGDHQTADYCTNRIPLIIRWPGMKGGGLVDEALHYNLDLPPTMADLLGQESPKVWDGSSFAQTVRDGSPAGHDYLVLSQCAWSCQRSVRFGPWIMIRTYHDGLKEFPPRMLFNLEEEPHETNNLADKHPHVVARAHAMLDEWHTEMMASSDSPVDPLWTVMREGGPLHTRDALEKYCERLRATGRGHHAERLERVHGR